MGSSVPRALSFSSSPAPARFIFPLSPFPFYRKDERDLCGGERGPNTERASHYHTRAKRAVEVNGAYGPFGPSSSLTDRHQYD